MGVVKILIVTHSPALYTGMAEVVRLIFESLLAKYPGKYQIEQLGLLHVTAVYKPLWRVHGTKTVRLPDGTTQLDREDLIGQKSFLEIAAKVRPDIVFAHNDPQNLVYLARCSHGQKWKLILYANFDSIPVPGDYKTLLAGAHIVTLSEFSKEAFLACGQPEAQPTVDVLYVPADVARFKPVADTEKKLIRDCNFPKWMPGDAFVIGWVGRNQWRKQMWLAYEATGLLRSGRYSICKRCGAIRRRSGARSCSLVGAHACTWVDATPLKDVYLWVHMPTGKEKGCWRIPDLEAVYGVSEGRDLVYTEGCSSVAQIAPEDMPALYQMWDALIFPSGGEGFGLPAWEAMACGLPVVYTEYSTHGEFLGKAEAGIAIGGLMQPGPQDTVLRIVGDVEQAVAALRRLYFEPNLRNELGANGRRFVTQYTPERVAEQWDAVFTRIRDSAGALAKA